MGSEEKVCVHCGKAIPGEARVCPACGEEQPIRWLLYLTYFLLGLFILGALYRLFWP
jgi:hypothetical protein